MAIGLDKTAIGLDKMAIGLDKMAIGLDKAAKMLFLPADKFFIRGHMNLAICGPNLGDLAIGLPLGKNA